MLSKQDLEAIDKLLNKRIDPLKEKILDLEDNLKDQKSAITDSIFNLRFEVREEFNKMKRRIREFREVFDEFAKHFDRITNHLKLPLIS